ncbi:MAG: PP2C family protein-serine/threonine phosphatase [Bacteroidia bacterium]
MNRLFNKKYFILYKPKDIVSGDFYWSASLTRQTEAHPLSLAAVVDCTGHGVPGAFLSIVANDFLKQCTIDKEVKNTNEILDYLNRNVSSNLNQSHNSKMRVKDGMDIAMIAIDYKNLKLYFSGANNPAYIYRQVKENIELIILKPTKQAIGTISRDILKYELQEIDLLPGDTIYLFSDGYPDQFGGTRDKKLNYKRFKEILAQAFELPIGLQKNFIEKKFSEWKLETEQTDDVCVMGIRI